MLPSIYAPRKRGAPLGNANALKLGLYSALSSDPVAALLPRLRGLKKAWHTNPTPAEDILASAHSLLKQIDALPETPDSLAPIRLSLDTHGLILRVARSTRSAGQPPQSSLQHPLELLRWDLARCGIKRDADSFLLAGLSSLSQIPSTSPPPLSRRIDF